MTWQEILTRLPDQPGVYMFKDDEGDIIYVGKAVSLRNRVRSYFRQDAEKNPKVKAMMQRAAGLEYLVTDSEIEALILESNLIKEHHPRYNVYLRDDKSYPFLKVTINENYPRVFITRRLLQDGARYFGPYTRVGAVHETLRLLKKLFPFRSCKHRDLPPKERPCLNYHIRRCLAPCCGHVSKNEYREMIQQVIMFLEGRQEEVIKQLKSRMQEAAANWEFERAAEIRDQLQAVEEVVEKQKVLSSGQEDQDVVAIARGTEVACVMLFFIRGGKLIGRDHFYLDRSEHLSRAEILTSFLKQYYHRAEYIPRQVLVEELLAEERDVLSRWLSERRGGKVEVKVPRRGEKRKLVEMAGKNALLMLEEETNRRELNREGQAEALRQLAEALHLDELPERMECYDISNIQGTSAVASMVVFEAGKPAKDQYRKFKIKTVEGPDDFAAMREVIRRRFSRAAEERELVEKAQLPAAKAKFCRLPQLVLVDGGKGQLSAALAAMRETGYDHIPVFGLAKEEELIYAPGRPEPIRLPRTSGALHLVMRLRDEAHRFAVTYHRRVRDQKNLRSLLDEVEGVGPKRRRELLKAFGTVDKIKQASVEELAAVPGMNRKVARTVYDFFRRAGN